jgi:hypothetical protein
VIERTRTLSQEIYGKIAYEPLSMVEVKFVAFLVVVCWLAPPAIIMFVKWIVI